MGPQEAGDLGSWHVFVGSCERRGRYDRDTGPEYFVLRARSRLAFHACTTSHRIKDGTKLVRQLPVSIDVCKE